MIGDLARRRAAWRKLREAILAELQPVALKNCTLKRFGSANDGGYLMCENLIEPIDAAYWYGVGINDDWGCDVSRRYHVRGAAIRLFRSCQAHLQRRQDLCFTTNASEIVPATGIRISSTLWKIRSGKNGDTDRRLIIKMDIEGAEWESLLAAPDELLASIPQIAMEMHGFDDPKILEVLRKLKRNFYLVNLHFNNWSCTPKAAPLPGLGVPGALGEQARRRAGSGGARPRTDESAKCTRLADVARLSVAHADVGPLTVHDRAMLCTECATGTAAGSFSVLSGNSRCRHKK